MADGVQRSERLDEYLDGLVGALGHADRHGPMRKYCTGLLLDGTGKSVEPMAARISPSRVSAEHQSLLHFVGQAPWDDRAVLRAAREYALPFIEKHGPIEATLFDDTGMPKKGKHSVGVANQYCGVLGKNHNCQVSATISLANESASIPVAHQLYLPKSWTEDRARCDKVGVPKEVGFARKWEISLALLDELLAEDPDIPRGTALGDAAFGDCFEFRDGLTTRGYRYALGVSKTAAVWAPGQVPRPVVYSGKGRPAEGLRRTDDNQPVTALEVARSLSEEQWGTVTWRRGTKGEMTSRFAAVRVRPARREGNQDRLLDEEWLLIEWPSTEDAPTKYWLSTEPDEIPIARLVYLAKLRCRIERDYQELKQEVGFGDYQGRGWRGYHHHHTLAVAAYVFLLAERTRLSPPHAPTAPAVHVAPLPRDFRPRGAPDPR